MRTLLLSLVAISSACAGSSEYCSAPLSTNVNIRLSTRRNLTGHWNITADLERSLATSGSTALTVDVSHNTRVCGDIVLEQLGSMATLDPISVNSPQTGAVVKRIALPPDYQHFPDFGWYKFYKDSLPWADARDRCQQDGADLMVVESEKERQEVYNKINPSDTSVWLGGYDLGHNGSWVTVWGTPIERAWWGPNQPNKKGAFCTEMYNKGLMDDEDCSYKYYFICEAPESSTRA